ncbi:MAG: DUF4355 domain-containing protein [Tannerellaceae bacterium]|nr:DUF4355 domain-containing protein [Tannerellaceae bacterium]
MNGKMIRICLYLYIIFSFSGCKGIYTTAFARRDSYSVFSDSVEDKYNLKKLIAENRRLMNFQQQNLILDSLFATICLSLIIEYLSHAKRKRNKYQSELSAYESLTKQLSKLNNQKEEIEKMKKQISQLKKELLLSSKTGKKLAHLSEKIIPGKTDSLLHDKDWLQIEKTVNTIYPSFLSSIAKIAPDMSPAEIQYCLLTLFEFDIQQEATLLNLNPESISKRRLRVKKRLGIANEDTNLQEYLTKLKEEIVDV